MPTPCRISIDAGTPQAITTAATVILQGTNSASKPVRLKRIQLQSNQTGANQQIVTVQLVTYTGATAGGTTVTAVPVNDALTGVYSPATAFKAITTTMGTTPANKLAWQWNTANPFDIVDGLEFAVSKIWAIIIPTAPSVGFNLTGTVNFEEFG